MKDKIKGIETEIENTIKAMDNVKEQIKVYNLKGEELARHGTYLKGKLDMLKELSEDDKNV